MSDKSGSNTVLEKEDYVVKVESASNHISSHDADVTLKFMTENDSSVPEITAEQEKKLAKKVVYIILILTSMTNLLLYADKATLSYASISGLWKDTGLT